MPKNSFFIDSCIFLGTIIKDENTRACKSFISRKSEILHVIIDMIISTNLENFVPLNNDLKIYSELRKADSRISESDIIHASYAKILDIPLVTTDGMLLNSQGLKKHIDVFYPADVI
ncbi:MAG: hypothetical protein KKG76_03430 [Euryarchaeota archaeon]|nr:hypothetical protein [Euryarchaeota archaeon]